MYRSCRPKMHLYSFRACISLSRRSHALNLLIPSSTRSGASPRLGSAQSAFQVASSNNPKIPLRHLIFVCGLLLGVHVFSEWEVLSPVNAVSFLDIARNSPPSPHSSIYQKSQDILNSMWTSLQPISKRPSLRFTLRSQTCASANPGRANRDRQFHSRVVLPSTCCTQ